MEKRFFQSSKYNIILDVHLECFPGCCSLQIQIREHASHYYYFFSILTSLFDKIIMLSLVNLCTA
jgi:hypothetical protein